MPCDLLLAYELTTLWAGRHGPPIGLLDIIQILVFIAREFATHHFFWSLTPLFPIGGVMYSRIHDRITKQAIRHLGRVGQMREPLAGFGDQDS